MATPRLPCLSATTAALQLASHASPSQSLSTTRAPRRRAVVGCQLSGVATAPCGDGAGGEAAATVAAVPAVDPGRSKCSGVAAGCAALAGVLAARWPGTALPASHVASAGVLMALLRAGSGLRLMLRAKLAPLEPPLLTGLPPPLPVQLITLPPPPAPRGPRGSLVLVRSQGVYGSSSNGVAPAAGRALAAGVLPKLGAAAGDGEGTALEPQAGLAGARVDAGIHCAGAVAWRAATGEPGMLLAGCDAGLAGTRALGEAAAAAMGHTWSATCGAATCAAPTTAKAKLSLGAAWGAAGAPLLPRAAGDAAAATALLLLPRRSMSSQPLSCTSAAPPSAGHTLCFPAWPPQSRAGGSQLPPAALRQLASSAAACAASAPSSAQSPSATAS